MYIAATIFFNYDAGVANSLVQFL